MNYLDAIPLLALFLGAVAAFWGAIEVGYRIGRWRHGYRADEKDQPVGAMVASILALLALVLGFTFSLAAQRFDSRREAALDEANAIETVYLRSKLLPEPERSEASRLVQQYVEQRLAGAGSEVQADLDTAIARSEELHRQLWDSAETVAARRDSEMTSLFVESLNELIEMHYRRLHVSIRGRIPLVIWIVLVGMSGIAFVGVGYQCGLSATRRSPVMPVFVLAFAVVLYLIADLDRPQEGLLKVSQQAVLDVQRVMHLEEEDRQPAQ